MDELTARYVPFVCAAVQTRIAEKALTETRNQTEQARNARTNAAQNLDAAEKAATAARASAIATAGDSLWAAEIARILRNGPATRASAPTLALPNIAVRALALLTPSIRPMAHDLRVFKALSNEKSHRVLGWQPVPPRTP